MKNLPLTSGKMSMLKNATHQNNCWANLLLPSLGTRLAIVKTPLVKQAFLLSFLPSALLSKAKTSKPNF